MSRAPARPIKRLLIANRGEIATRIITSARELNLETYAVYVPGDDSHAVRAAHAIKLDSAASFMSIDALITICKQHSIDAVHPGYGFLSESSEFAKRMWDEANVAVVGPGWGILANTGDKLKARQLAERCHVPVSPALQSPTDCVEHVQRFAAQVGYPIMIKAVDGGGGRGIRLVREESQLASLFARAVAESPSKQVFAEKASVDGFRHVEVQIIGDGTGNVTHLWERECSIQRRFQKVIEVAPSTISDRKLIAKLIEDALRMARTIHYFSLGTFEFLLHPRTSTYTFLEINPRLQVEHTISEALRPATDLVRTQLLLAQGATLQTCELPRTRCDDGEHAPPPQVHAIQMRVVAEDVGRGWALSVGRVAGFCWPAGNGVRVDSHLVAGRAAVVSSEFDSLLAKIIVTAGSWEGAVAKARVALADTQIAGGVRTNLGMLRAIVRHPDFVGGRCSTQWLEDVQGVLLEGIKEVPGQGLRRDHLVLAQDTQNAHIPSLSTSPPLLRKGDAWTLSLTPTGTSPTPQPPPQTTPTPASPSKPTHLQITHIHRNAFPTHLHASILLTSPSQPQTPQPYTLTLHSTPTTPSHHARAPANPLNITVPFPGRLVEMLVEVGDMLHEGDAVCVVAQMKMEVEVRAERGGRVGWVAEVEEGEEVREGMVVVVLEEKGML